MGTVCTVKSQFYKEMKSMNHQTDVSYCNKSADVTLAGTLTLPVANGPSSKGPFPVVLLIAGMGPVDRDGTNYFGKKPFLALANHLTECGVAVLRVDKRGVGKSTGTFDQTVTCRDLADDVLAGVEFLKTCTEIDAHRIGLIGHSEGGLVATIVAAESTDIAFVVLMAGAVANSTQSQLEQTVVQMTADGASAQLIAQDSVIRKQVLDTIKAQAHPEQAKRVVSELFADYWTLLPEDLKKESQAITWAFSQANFEGRINFMNSISYRFMLMYDSFAALAQIKVPLLAIYGEYDFMAPHIVFPFIEEAMLQAKNRDYTILELPGLNHSFQTCKTGAMAEYATIEEVIAPLALQTMSHWILAKVTNR